MYKLHAEVGFQELESAHSVSLVGPGLEPGILLENDLQRRYLLGHPGHKSRKSFKKLILNSPIG